MSNVSPTVPHTVLTEKLSQLGLKLVSPITFLRIGAPLPEYSHILSFRRQVYIEPNQSSINLPESLEIIHDAVTYRIFLSLDSHKCFKCNRQGHIASQCPMLSQTQTNITNTTTQSYIQQEAIIREQTDKQQTTTSCINEPSRLEDETHEPASEGQSHIAQRPTEHQNTSIPHTSSKDMNIQIKTPKRNFSEAISPTTPTPDLTSDITNPPTFAIPRTTGTTKKHKPDSQPSNISSEALKSAKLFIDTQKHALTLNSDQFKSLLENTHGTKDITNIIKDYTDDIKGLIEMILLVDPHITDKTLKNRCTRLRKKLERHMDNNTNECLSDTSSMDSTTY
nr:unnamed protein product [Callosobruchus analis]